MTDKKKTMKHGRKGEARDSEEWTVAEKHSRGVTNSIVVL